MMSMKCLIIVAVQVICSYPFPSDLNRVARQQSDCKPIFHHRFENSVRTPQLKAIHDGTKLKICYRLDTDNSENYSYSCIDTTDFRQFTNPQTMKFAQSAHLDGLIYDDNKKGQSTMLSLRNAYPAYIAISEKNASSSVDDNQSWVESCKQCVQSTSSNNSEIYKSSSGTFWASFNDNNRVITSTDMRSWDSHNTINPDVKIHNIFPINLANQTTDKWVLVQNVTNPTSYYPYYLGTISPASGFSYEGVSSNVSYGVDDIELFFASKGDMVDDFQYMLPTLINTYVEEGNNISPVPFKTPVILAIPRKVMFKEINGEQRLVQVPALDYKNIPKTFDYPLQNITLMDGMVNPLQNIRTTSFYISLTFDLQESKEVGFKIRMSTDKSQRTQIGYLIGDIFYVDRSNSGLPPGMPSSDSLQRYQRRYDARERIMDRSNIMFQIYADDCSLEVFFDQGQATFNLLIFPLPTSDRLELYTSRDPTVLRNFQLVTFD